MKKLAIIGSGDLGQLIAYHAEQDGHYSVTGFFDDFRQKGDMVGSHPIVGALKDVLTSYENGDFDCIMVAIGYKHFIQRSNIFSAFYGKIPLARIIHSSAYVDASCHIGEGVFILPGCVLDRNVKIGNNVLLNTAAVIAHDTAVDDHTFISPRVAVAGFVKIGKSCNIGINTTIIDNISIADHVQTGGGTVVTKNLLQSGLYVGSPARFIK